MIEVDVPLTLFVMCTLFYAVRIPSEPRLRYYLLAAVFAGLATSTKYSGAVLGVSVLVAHLVALQRQRSLQRPAAADGARPSRRRRGKREHSVAPTHTATDSPAIASRALWLRLGLAGVVGVVVLLVTSPYIVLDFETFLKDFNYERTHMRGGHFGLDATPTPLWYGRVLTSTLLGWPLALCGVFGLVWLVGIRKRAWAAVVAIYPMVYVTILSTWSMKADRYVLPIVPIAGLLAMAAWTDISRRRLRPSLAVASLALAAAVLTAPSLAQYPAVLERARGDTRTAARQWFLDNVPGGSYVVSEAYGPVLPQLFEFINMDAELRERLAATHPDQPVYAYLQIPIQQMGAELLSVFYDLDHYEFTDYLVTSSHMRGRYVREPARYPTMVRFYEELDNRWELVKTFGLEVGSGPKIRIYRNPAQDTPFSLRGRMPSLASQPRLGNPGFGLVALHMRDHAINLEGFGYLGAAAETYELALTYTPLTRELRRDCVLGAARSWLRARAPERALALLESAESQSPTSSERAYWQGQLQRYEELMGETTSP